MTKNLLPSFHCVVTLCLTGLVTLPLAQKTSAEILATTVPFMSPGGDYVTQQDRYHTFRIPGMIVLPEGTILAFAEGRRGRGHDPRRDENAPIDIVMRRSADSGTTWQPLTVIESGFRPDGELCDFGDPTPVFDQATKTLFLFYGQWADKGPIFPAHGQNVAPSAGDHTLWMRSSSDFGQSWSERRQLIYPDSPAQTSDGLYWRFVEPGPGNGIQLKWQTEDSRNGRLVVPMKRAGSSTPDGKAQTNSFVYFSDDHGETWQLGDLAPGPQGNEDEIVELTDGRLLLDTRPNEGDYRLRHISSDGGATWGPERTGGVALPRVDASMARYSARREGQDRDRVLFSAPRGEKGLNRNNITVWTSYDEGQTFGNPIGFNQGFAAYSVVARLADGTIGLLVETQGDTQEQYGAITFYRYDLAELEPGPAR